MFAAERLKIIRQYLQANGQLEVTSISTMLGVSEVTIRRDLERLEQENFLIRTHGGALLNTDSAEAPLPPVQDAPSPYGREIVQTVLSLLQPGDVIMLSSGPLAGPIARELENTGFSLTVLTNDLAAAQALNSAAQIRTVLLGGQLDIGTGAVYGALTLANMERFYVNKFFFECDALSPNLTITVSSTEKAEFIQGALSIAEEKIMLCPSDRLGKAAFYRVGDLSLVNAVVTDSAVSYSYKKAVFERNLRLYTSIDLYEFRHTRDKLTQGG